MCIRDRSSASGSEYLLSFLGQGNFEGFGQALRYNSSNAQTDHERRVGMLRLIKLGLVPYVVQSPYADGLNVVWTAPAAAEGAVRPGWRCRLLRSDKPRIPRPTQATGLGSGTRIQPAASGSKPVPEKSVWVE